MPEREVKVSFSGRVAVSPLDVVAGIGTCTVDEVDQVATYFDTDRLSLTRAGASLRFRSDDGWTVKLPTGDHRGLLVRDEYVVAGEPGDPPSAAVDLVRGWVRHGVLAPVAQVHTRRHRAVVDDGEGPLIEVVVDDVEGRALSSGHTVRFLEAEVESKRDDDAGAADAIDTVVARLVALGGDTETQLPKVARVLGTGTAAPELADSRRRHPETIHDLVRNALANSTRRLIECDATVRRDADGEGVHQARTSARRLRSDLHTFGRWLDPDWCDELRSELRWLGTELGRVRDANVMYDSLATKITSLAPDGQADAAVLLRRLGEMRRREYEALLEAMRSDRYVTLLDRLVSAAQAPRFDGPPPNADGRRDAARVARQRARTMRKDVRTLPPSPSDHDLHEVRKRAKRARYAFEAISPFLGKKAERAAEALKKLQDALGAHQDAVVAIDWLSTAAADSDAGVAFAAGRLAARYELEMVEARRTWYSDWRRAKRRLERFT